MNSILRRDLHTGKALCEIWVAIAEDGNFEVATSADDAITRFSENVDDAVCHLGLIKMPLSLPTPEVITVTGGVDAPTQPSINMRLEVTEVKEQE